MKIHPGIAALCLVLRPGLAPGAEPPVNPAIAPHLSDLRDMLGEAQKAVNQYYMPASKVDQAFAQRCRDTASALREAQSLSEGYALISDALGSLDPRIRFYPPNRAVHIDFSWDWGLIGNEAYVNQVDQVGAARQQGLQLGDRILAIEGVPVSRDNYQQVFHLFNVLSALPGLRVLAQSPGGEPRLLAIAATMREPHLLRQTQKGDRPALERVRNASEQKRHDEFLTVKDHVCRLGHTTVWNAAELYRDSAAVEEAWPQLKSGENLIVDLRHHYLHEPEAVLRLAGGLFSHEVDIGRIARDSLDIKLRLAGRKDAFAGQVLVLVDAETGGYAELLAYVIQHEQRGVIVGDRTMGRVFERRMVYHSSGRPDDFHNTAVALPAGELVLREGGPLDGHGVIPDLQILPQPADLAGHRDVVLSRALALLKQKTSARGRLSAFPPLRG